MWVFRKIRWDSFCLSEDERKTVWEGGLLGQLIEWQVLEWSIFSQPNLIKYLLPFFLSPILDVLRLCNSCQTLQCGPRNIALSKSVLNLSMVRIFCKAFKKRRVVCTQKLIIRALILLAGLCGWNVAEAHICLQRLPSSTGTCTIILFWPFKRAMTEIQTKQSPHPQNNSNKIIQTNQKHTEKTLRKQKHPVTSFSCLQTLEVYWINAVLKSFFFFSPIYLLFLFKKSA